MPKSSSTHPVESPTRVYEDVQIAEPIAAVTKTPEQWAEVYFPATPTGRHNADLWKHSSAVQLHGWKAYEERSGRRVQLTAELYEAAVAAVSANDFKAHPGADYRSRS